MTQKDRKKLKRVNAIKKALKYAIMTLMAIAVLSFIILNGKVCTGDYEGDIDAVCTKIIK